MPTLREYFAHSEADIDFSDRPNAIPGDLRPEWSISLILLIILKVGYASKASLEKLHVIYWAARSKDNRGMFLRLIYGSGRPDDMIVRFEPALIRALDFAVGEGLVELKRPKSGGINVNLTDKGRKAATALAALDDCFKEEGQFLNALRGHVSQAKIEQILSWGEG